MRGLGWLRRLYGDKKTEMEHRRLKEMKKMRKQIFNFLSIQDGKPVKGLKECLWYAQKKGQGKKHFLLWHL